MPIPALSFVDRVIFNASTAGTSSFIQAGAVTGYQTMQLAGASNGAQYGYAAQTSDLSQWEVGYGTWTAATQTLTRTVLFNSSGTFVAINFTSVPQVMVTALAESLSAAVGGGTVTEVDTGTGLTGGPITSSGTVALANTVVGPGSYTNANITVDQQGRLTAASTGSSGPSAANPTAVAGPIAVTGSAATYMRSDAAPAIQLGNAAVKGIVQVDNATITAAAGIISLANTAVVPGAYTDSNVTVDQQGRITSISNGTGGASGVMTAVNVKDFGATGNGVTDDTAAIQAAIDFAIPRKISAVFVPAGNYVTSSPLYLDPPNNIRMGNYNAAAFSLALIGDFGGANHERYGTALLPNFTNNIVLVVGTGQGMRVSNIQILGPGNANGLNYRGMQDSSGVGIAVAGGSGGATRTLIENCSVGGFYTLIAVGTPGVGALGDTTTIYKCFLDNGYYGISTFNDESFATTVSDCVIGECTVSVAAPEGPNVNVYGGNISPVIQKSTTLGLSGVSGLTLTGSYTYSLTATLTAPAWNISTNYDSHTCVSFGGVIYFSQTGGAAGFQPNLFPSFWAPLSNCIASIFNGLATVTNVFNAFTMVTANFGAIPLFVTAFNSGTNVVSLQIYNGWAQTYNLTNAITTTDLQAELQAVSTLFAVELPILFQGAINVFGCFTEMSAIGPYTLIDTTVGFAGGRPASCRGLISDSDPSCWLFGATFNSQPAWIQALYLTAQVFPFIVIGATQPLELCNCSFQMGANVPIDWVAAASPETRLSAHDNFGFRPNFRFLGFGYPGAQDINSWTSGTGAGDHDGGPSWSFKGAVEPFTNSDAQRTIFLGRSPFVGNRPAQWTMPMIVPADLATLEGTLPAISPGHINYPLLWGGQIYRIGDWYTGLQPAYQCISNHYYYTYGQDLTTSNVSGCSWSYKGQSFTVNLDVNSLDMMFNGMGIVLNNGVGDFIYIVTGVYYALGYITVLGGNPGPVPPNYLQGTKTTVYTGTTIKQQPYAITRIGTPNNINYQVPVTGGGITLANSDSKVILNPAGTLSTFTVEMPPAPYNGQEISIRSSQVITTLTVQPNSGQSVVAAPATLAVGQTFNGVYRTADTTWYF